ncbi:MAG TPA: ABC transporter ATP-binding protein [Thermoplasmata archaeon]|nr:ABC transporter ATP-binding protein [Thermoplasmata archaeon]
MSGPLVEVDSVTKEFGPQTALAGISARLTPGTIGLVGPNGAGKTTLLRLLLGLIPPSGGALRVFGLDTMEHPLGIRERVGYMPEHDCLIPTMTGIGFVAFMGQVSGLPRETALSRAHDVLQFVGIHEERYRRIREYSVGMRQRVKLAQAIVHDPPLCLLDEPTAGLDPGGRLEMLELLRTLSKLPGRSLLLSTHLLPDVEGLCDQIVLLNSGRLLAAGPLEPLLAARRSDTIIRIKGELPAFVERLSARGIPVRTEGPEVFARLPDGGARAVFEAAREAGVQVRFLGDAVRSVEELFLTMVQDASSGAPP